MRVHWPHLGTVIQTLPMRSQDFCLLLSVSICPYENVALHSSNCNKMSFKILLVCLMKLFVKYSQENSHHGDLHIRERLYTCHISIQSSGFIAIFPILYYVASCSSAKCLTRRSWAAVTSSALMLVKGKPPMNHLTSLQGWPWKTPWKCPFLFPPWELVSIVSLFWQSGVEVVTSRPFLAPPFSQGSMHSIRGF